MVRSNRPIHDADKSRQNVETHILRIVAAQEVIAGRAGNKRAAIANSLLRKALQGLRKVSTHPQAR